MSCRALNLLFSLLCLLVCLSTEVRASVSDEHNDNYCLYDSRVHLSYKPYAFCPDKILESAGAQSSSFHGCEALPQRLCVAEIPSNYIIPPDRSAFRHNPPENNVRLNQIDSGYSSFTALAKRETGDCVTCWRFAEEKTRWSKFLRFIENVSGVSFGDDGPIRTALDFGSGAGGFLSALADRGIMGLGFARNWRKLPYLETAAARGVLAMHLDFRYHVPMASNAVDLVHCSWLMNILSTREEIEAVMIEWDRLARPGGLIVQHGFRSADEETYNALKNVVLETARMLRWKNLYWRATQVLTFVFSKPLHRTSLDL